MNAAAVVKRPAEGNHSRAGWWSRDRTLLAALCLAAFLVRFLYVLTLDPKIFWFDGQEYSRLARGLVEQGRYVDSLGRPSAFWPPGYPLFLAVVYKLLGAGTLGVRIVQSLVGAVTVGLVHVLGCRLVGRRAALIAALAATVYPLYIYSAGAFFPVALQTGLLAGLVLLASVAVERESRARAAAAGVLAGWAALTAASALAAAIVILGWLVWVGGSGGSGARFPRRRGAGLALAFLLPFVLCVGAWTIRNDRLLGRPVPVSTNGGINFWLGNYPGVKASTGNREDVPGMKETREAIWGAAANEVERDRAFSAKAREYIAADPGRFVVLSLAKAVYLWALFPEPMTQDRPRFALEKAASLLSYGVLLPFALVWLARSLRRSRSAVLVALLFVVYTAVHAVVISKVRFRLPLDTFVIIYGCGGMVALYDRVRRRRP
jgi:hypothetical protein